MGKLKAAVIGLTVGEMHIIDYIANPDIEEIVLAFVFLHENFTSKSLVGCILIAAGTLLMTL